MEDVLKEKNEKNVLQLSFNIKSVIVKYLTIQDYLKLISCNSIFKETIEKYFIFDILF